MSWVENFLKINKRGGGGSGRLLETRTREYFMYAVLQSDCGKAGNMKTGT